MRYDTLLSGLVAALALFCGMAQANILLIQENFDGDATNLDGKEASAWHADLTTADGSNTWAAHTNFQRDGSVSGSGFRSAHLNLGSYINDAKGAADGKFFLTATISEVSGSNWLSLGFATPNTPDTEGAFTTYDEGIATIAYRENGELSMWGGPGTQNEKSSTESQKGSRTLTVALDLTEYDNPDNFGTVTWEDSVLGEIDSYAYDEAKNFGSVLISAAGSTGSYSDLTLTQIPEPGTWLLLLSALAWGLLVRRRR